MNANPGGEIDPKDVIGRDALIQNLWRILKQQSAIIVAERRMGKTSIVKKMRKECPANIILLYRDVEGVQSPLEFVERIYQDMEAYFSVLRKGTGYVRKLFAGLAGVEIGNILKFPADAAKDWKRILEAAMADLSQHLDGKTVVFVWDELPLMLQKISEADTPRTAMDVLDTLRGLRQSHPGIRLVFTGSIGLHHVVAGLKAEGHMNDATNDMASFEIPELENGDACDLTRRLMAGEQIKSDDQVATVAAIVEHTNAIPFYIHHVIRIVQTQGVPTSAVHIAKVVEGAMSNPQDPWHLAHFRERLTTYYGEDRLPVVLKILDEAAAAADPVSFKYLLRRIAGSMKPEASLFTARILKGEEESLRNLLELLQRDHYLVQDPTTGHYQFRFQLIRRWWRLKRNLMP